MADDFKYDVFLSHSSKDKDVVRVVAERLRADGLLVWFDEWELRPVDSIPAKIEEGLEQSRVLVLCMSVKAFGSEWAQLEAGTFRFRDPLNKDRRFIPLRLDEAPIKGSLAQFLYINWRSGDREQEYAKLLEACRPPAQQPAAESQATGEQPSEEAIQLDSEPATQTDAFSPVVKRTLTDGDDKTVLPSDEESGRCLHVLKGHRGGVFAVALSPKGDTLTSGSQDKSIGVWDVGTGECIRMLKGHTDSVREIVFGSNKRIYSASDDGSIRVWSLGTGETIAALTGHLAAVYALALTPDGKMLVSGSRDGTMRVWDIERMKCEAVFNYGNTWVNAVVVTPDGKSVVAGTEDGFITLWDIALGEQFLVLGHHANYWVWGLALAPNGFHLVSGSGDSTVGLWDLKSRKRLAILEGHSDKVSKVAITQDGRWAVSGSLDKTAVIWDLNTGKLVKALRGHDASVECVAISTDGQLVVSGSYDRCVRVWNFTPRDQKRTSTDGTSRYTNAKVLLVGESGAGKTGLSRRLALNDWQPSDSTVGAWATQWKLPVSSGDGVEREIWLWDFGGQADQRLVHQLYMDRAALIVLLFDADKEDVLPGLREWQTALRRCVPVETPLVLVAGRIDAGFRASRAKLQSFAKGQGFRYFETSAKEGTNCEALSRAITEVIPWGQMEKRTSPRIFKLIKDEILKLRDEGQVLDTFKELREVLWQRLADEPRFTDETLKTVIGLLDGPGIVKELDYGTYILLQPEWINAYAQAVIRTLRQQPSELGALPLRSIEEGKLLFQTVERDGGIVNMKRLPEAEERVVLREMERQLDERGLCLRQSDKLVFPSHCGRERPEKLEYPSVFVSYAVQGYLDDLYATLVVKLADCESFKLKELWRDAADFETLKGDHHMGIKLTREAAGSGDITVYFAPGVTIQEQVIFANYIHAHLQARSEQVQRLRYYVCPHCGTPKGNPQVLMEKLLAKKKEASVECDICEERFDLWDDLEKLFASDDVRKLVEDLQVVDAIRLDSRRKGKLLALEVSSRITSADQKCFEIPCTEDEGIDMELEFTDNDGKGSGKRLYLQLKSGNSHLKKRKDGVEIFAIKEQRWVDYWLKQSDPVMLVIGTFPQDDERLMGREKLEFSEVRWMEISSYLVRESENGTKPVTQIEFKGERLDMTSIRRSRDRALSQG